MSDFKPDWVSPPGDTIKELLVQRLAKELYLSEDNTRKLLEGNYPLTKNIIDNLIVLFGCSTPISFWENLESRYRKELDRIYNIDVGEVDTITRGKVNQTYYSGPKDPSPNGIVVSVDTKSYLIQKHLCGGSLVKLIRHLTHQDKVDKGFYWDAAQNFKNLFQSRPSFEVELGPSGKLLSFKKYIYGESLIKLSDALYKVISTPNKFP